MNAVNCTCGAVVQPAVLASHLSLHLNPNRLLQCQNFPCQDRFPYARLRNIHAECVCPHRSLGLHAGRTRSAVAAAQPAHASLRDGFDSDTEDFLDISGLEREPLLGYGAGGQRVDAINGLAWQTSRANLNMHQWFRVAIHPDKGRQVLSRQIFGANVVLAEYFGHGILNHEELSDIERKKVAGTLAPFETEYLFNLEFGRQKLAVQAKWEDGTVGRLVNHAAGTDANCVAQNLPRSKMPRIILVSTRKIDVDDEIVYDYGDKIAREMFA